MTVQIVYHCREGGGGGCHSSFLHNIMMMVLIIINIPHLAIATQFFPIIATIALPEILIGSPILNNFLDMKRTKKSQANAGTH